MLRKPKRYYINVNIPLKVAISSSYISEANEQDFTTRIKALFSSTALMETILDTLDSQENIKDLKVSVELV